LASKQGFVKVAPVSLAFMVDAGRIYNSPGDPRLKQQVKDLKERGKLADTAFISQNV